MAKGLLLIREIGRFHRALTRETPIRKEDSYEKRNRVQVLGCMVEEFDAAVNAWWVLLQGASSAPDRNRINSIRFPSEAW